MLYKFSGKSKRATPKLVCVKKPQTMGNKQTDRNRHVALDQAANRASLFLPQETCINPI